MKKSIPAIMLGLLFLISGGCEKGTPVISVDSPQAVISPMLIGVASIFMTINNTGNGDDTLLEARTDIPDTVTELHDVVDGRMVKVDEIDIPSREAVVLRPGRHHIMVLKMPNDMLEGAGLTLLLKFRKSGEKAVPMQLTKFEPAKLWYQ